MTENTTRPLYTIAREIYRTWDNINYGAKPYLEAMLSLNSIHHNYGCDSGKSVVLYFIANAGTWCGDDARRIKAELKSMCK